MVMKILSSLKLTLALLLGLAVVAIFGTLTPPADGRYELFYQGPWFRGLLGLLVVNLLACTLKTIRRKWREEERLFDQLDGGPAVAGRRQQRLPLPGSTEELAGRLRRAGWHPVRRGERWLGRRHRAGRWGSTVVHLSLLVIMAGCLAGELGFVGTLTLYVGDQSHEYFDWSRQQDLPLGFTLRLDAFAPVYYPIELRFAAVDEATGRTIRTYTAREGEQVELPVPGMAVVVKQLVPEEESLTFDVYRRGTFLGEYHTVGGTRQPANPVDPGVALRLVAYRDPILKQLHSEMSILAEGRVVKQGVIEVNRPLTYRGVTIYQTAYQRDQFGFWIGGYQLSRDPGEPLVWIGCLLLMAGLALAFAVPCRTLGLVRQGDELLLVGLGGMGGEAGRRHFERTAELLSSAPDHCA